MKRTFSFLAGLTLLFTLALACTDDVDTQPVPDLQEILDQEGIDDIRYGNGNGNDTIRGNGGK